MLFKRQQKMATQDFARRFLVPPEQLFRNSAACDVPKYKLKVVGITKSRTRWTQMD